MNKKKNSAPTVASLSNALETLQIQLEMAHNRLALALTERNEYLTLLGLHYQMVHYSGEAPLADLRGSPLHQEVRKSLDFYSESGTVRSAYANPLLRAVSVQNWNENMALLMKDLGSDEECVLRYLQCKGCTMMYTTALPLSLDSISCPKCGALIKVA